MPTRKQKRVAEILAADKDITMTKALVKAGYSPITARSSQKKILEGSGTVSELTRIEGERSDSARSIKRLAAEKLRQRLQDGSASDPLVIAGWKTAHEIAQDEPQGGDPYIPEIYRRRIRRALDRAWTLGYRACERQHNLRDEQPFPPQA